MSWGSLLERYVFEKVLPISYSWNADETILHPEIHAWAGSPDGMKFDEENEHTVTDMKCPGLKAFCQMVFPIYIGFNGTDAITMLRNGFKHKDFEYKPYKEAETYYWQLVSNAVITGAKFAELIVFCPYKSELPAIREMALQSEEKRFQWINFAADSELSHLLDGGYFKNLNIIRFNVPQSDKDFLTEKVKEAEKLLITI